MCWVDRRLLGLVLVITGSVCGLIEVRLGVLLMTEAQEPFDLRRVGPALDVAFNLSEQVYGVKYNITYHNYTGFCPKQKSLGYFTELYYEENIQAIVGPACSESLLAVGRLAQYLGIPVISGVGDLIIREPGDMYNTFTRMSYNLAKFSTSVQAIMRRYEWSNIAVIYDLDYVFFELAGSNLVRDFKGNPEWPRPADLNFKKSTLTDYSALLKEASLYARFIVLFCDAATLRKFLYHAHLLGQTSGEYAFFTIELFPSDWLGYYMRYKKGDFMDYGVTQAYRSLLLMTLSRPDSPEFRAYEAEVKRIAREKYNYEFGNEQVNYFITAFYDGLLYLSESYNRTVRDGEDINNGSAVAQKLWNNTYKGISGTVAIDELGDRIADFDVFDLSNPDTEQFEIVGRFYGSTQQYQTTNISIKWVNGLPFNEPPCGFVGNKCSPSVASNKTTMILAISFVAVMVVVTVICLFVYRKLKYESEVGKKTWLVNWSDIHQSAGVDGGSCISRSRMSIKIAASQGNSSIELDGRGQVFATIGQCRGNLVAIRKLKSPCVELNKAVLREFRQLQLLQHSNLARFIGATTDAGKAALLMEYCPRGSLQDIIENEDINLDWTFRYSLIWDIIKGMQYIHESNLKYHGRLSSTNCVIDSRFMLKLTDYGLPTIYLIEEKHGLKKNELNKNRYLWVAPELLRLDIFRQTLKSAQAFQKADVFSFGIILQEIILRAAPYEGSKLSTEEIIEKVKEGSPTSDVFRPVVPINACSTDLQLLMQICWAEVPGERPSFDSISASLKKINRGSKGNIMDNLMKRMEQYANNLESLVTERTHAYLEEKKKAVELLHRLLPPSVADQLESGGNVMPESYDCVTVYFSDIVGFTSISAKSTPMNVIQMLNDLYTCFDSIIDRFDVYKVETIGDAYMVVSGLPKRNGNNHADQIARMCLKIREATFNFKIRHLPHDQLRIRIGLHSGSCVAGVVGLTMPRYCLFGDTINTASRMESTSEAQKIQISHSTRDILIDNFNGYNIEDRGEIPVKGKGMMKTYWLLGVID